MSDPKLCAQDSVDRLTIDQYETLVRKSKSPHWCICADPIHCDQRMPAYLRACRARALGFPVPPQQDQRLAQQLSTESALEDGREAEAEMRKARGEGLYEP